MSRARPGLEMEDDVDAILDQLMLEPAVPDAEASVSARPIAPALPAGAAIISIGAVQFLADLSGALWHQTERTLLVADLHLEKASRFASRGQFLPPYDTAETLQRLGTLIDRYAPKRLVCLGDSFHDVRALERMAPADRSQIAALARRTQILWISGNHDPDMPGDLPGERADRLVLAGIMLRHEPSIEGCGRSAEGPEICGHLHPVARVATKRGSLRRRCFIGSPQRLVMPAFGALTGGLNVRDAAFDAVLGAEQRHAYVVGRQSIYPIARQHLVHD